MRGPDLAHRDFKEAKQICSKKLSETISKDLQEGTITVTHKNVKKDRNYFKRPNVNYGVEKCNKWKEIFISETQ